MGGSSSLPTWCKVGTGVYMDDMGWVFCILEISVLYLLWAYGLHSEFDSVV